MQQENNFIVNISTTYKTFSCQSHSNFLSMNLNISYSKELFVTLLDKPLKHRSKVFIPHISNYNHGKENS